MGEFEISWIKMIKTCKNDTELAACIEKIYDYGYADGYDDGQDSL